jgi:hypothetical protein
MSFSWSAPQVTPEQETLERESMSSEERATIVADIYGSNNSSVDENIDAISDVHMHISLISSDEKVAYLEANERCPDLVATESNAMTFLRADRYSPEVRFVSLFVLCVCPEIHFKSNTYFSLFQFNHALLVVVCCTAPRQILGVATHYIWRTRVSSHDTTRCAFGGGRSFDTEQRCHYGPGQG